jgi:indole-3-acetate monooxygenase
MTELPTAATNGRDLDQAADDLAALARRLAPEAEKLRRLPDELADGLRGSGLFRAGAPSTTGAAEAPPAVTLRLAETVARGDASAGWCVAIAATSSLLGGWLAAEGLTEVFGDPDNVAAGVWAPRGAATRVDGGYRVSGRWSFCSGITHSDYLFGGCIVDGGADGGGTPRVLGLPVAELEIVDTWKTSGLRATGSHDAIAVDVFVPESRSLWLLDAPTSSAALYRFPILGFFALSIAAAALGNARGALDDFKELAVHKVGLGSSRTLAQRPATWSVVAENEASLRAARAFYYQAVDDAWRAAQSPSGEPVSVPLRTALRLAATHATRSTADVVRAMYDLGGGAAIYDDSPLQRRFRDAHAATAHFQVNAATWELCGRLLLDQPTDPTML